MPKKPVSPVKSKSKSKPSQKKKPPVPIVGRLRQVPNKTFALSTAEKCAIYFRSFPDGTLRHFLSKYAAKHFKDDFDERTINSWYVMRSELRKSKLIKPIFEKSICGKEREKFLASLKPDICLGYNTFTRRQCARRISNRAAKLAHHGG